MPRPNTAIAKSTLRRPNKHIQHRRCVFVSCHKDDLKWKDKFVQLMRDRIIDKSVDTSDVDDTGMKTDNVFRLIRDDYISGATVTVVLIGKKTWQRKFVDWEIGSSLRATKKNKRTGLIGIVLPSHPNHGSRKTKAKFIPPRLAPNCEGDDPFTKVYDWPEPFAPAQLQRAIEEAFDRRKGANPVIGSGRFRRNRTGRWDKGWQ